MIKDDEKRVVLIKIGRSDYGIDIKDILEIIKVPIINKLPKVKDYILGIINLRGNIIPIIDLKKDV